MASTGLVPLACPAFADREGRIVRWSSCLTDIEDRKRSEAALKRNEEFLADAQRLSSTGSFMWNLTAGEIIFSKETYRITGWTPLWPVTFESIRARTHPDELAELQEHIEQAQRRLDLDFERRLLMPDGSVKYLHYICLGGQGSAGSNRVYRRGSDVTGRRARRTRSEGRSELAHVARGRGPWTLAASIAHEVNQPLSGIITNAIPACGCWHDDPPTSTARAKTRDARSVMATVRLT